MTLERKLKIALDESRLLILGAQVLFGFQFNGIFQELFDELPRLSRALAAAGLTLLMATIGLLVAPSMQHRIAEQGQDSPRVLAIGTISVVWALLPLCPSRSPSMCSSRWTASPGRRGEWGLAWRKSPHRDELPARVASGLRRTGGCRGRPQRAPQPDEGAAGWRCCIQSLTRAIWGRPSSAQGAGARARRRRRVTWTTNDGPTIWLAVHLQPGP